VARHPFGGGPADFVCTVKGGVFAPVSARITFWTASTAGTQVTDLLDANGSVVTSIQTDGAGQFPPFQGPADGTAQMWADAGGSRALMQTTAETVLKAGGTTITVPHGPGTAVANNGLTIQFQADSTGQGINVKDPGGLDIFSVGSAGGPGVFGDMFRVGPALLGTNFAGVDGRTNPPSLLFPPTDAPHRMWFTDGNPATAIVANPGYTTTIALNDLAWDHTNGVWYTCTFGGVLGVATWAVQTGSGTAGTIDAGTVADLGTTGDTIDGGTV
jgi:hypothetical protein